jgi:hypothetical protein
MDEMMTVEEKYKRILKILATRNQIIVAQAEKIFAQAEKIFQLEETLENCLVTLPYDRELENPPPREATQNDMEDAIVRSSWGHEVLAYDIGKERFVHRDD